MTVIIMVVVFLLPLLLITHDHHKQRQRLHQSLHINDPCFQAVRPEVYRALLFANQGYGALQLLDWDQR